MSIFVLIMILFVHYSSNLATQIKGNRINLLDPEAMVAPPPSLPKHKPCGYIFNLGIESGRFADGVKVPIYYLNDTAEQLAAEGFKITADVINGDVINRLTYSNGSFSNTLEYTGISGVSPAGGEIAELIRSYYMAQLGERRGGKITWLCDGVLVSRQWVLTAAHCFTKTGVDPNLVRLGDLSVTDSESAEYYGQQVRDYSIADVIVHPEFKIGERYHDIALIRLPRSVPNLSMSIRPICLPWGFQTGWDLVGTDVVLTGWGATKFGGKKTTILQQVDLRVFDSSVCNESYASLRDTREKYPRGISNDDVLCVGSEEGGKDACGGDSGGPIVYQKGIYGELTLAGIVSGGYGCGLKEFPGLYTPINKPKYLRWIKEVAFKDSI